MATNANWTIVFEDKCIIKNYAEGAAEGIGYIINDDSFKTAMNDIIQLHTEMILNSDIEDKEVREIAYIKVKVVNEILSHLQSIADGDKIKKAKGQVGKSCYPQRTTHKSATGIPGHKGGGYCACIFQCARKVFHIEIAILIFQLIHSPR